MFFFLIGIFIYNFIHSFSSLAKCCKSKVDFFADRLHNAMAGMGTNDKTLIRIIVSRSEIDLGDIKEAFANKYGKSLESWIKVCFLCPMCRLGFIINNNNIGSFSNQFEKNAFRLNFFLFFFFGTLGFKRKEYIFGFG